MSARLRALARENGAIVATGGYRAPGGHEVSLARAVSAALSGTRAYGPDPVPVAVLDTDRVTVFEVTGESSLAAAARMTGAAPGKVAVLNFASARNPGGGYLNGARAQEEDLCRASALHATLLRAPEHYAHHRAHRSALYSDRVIHSPGVPVFRDDRERLLDAPYQVGFLTCPAPNAGVVRRAEPQNAHRVPAVLAGRAERVLEVAAVRGYRRLVLGAWGCGVFRNDPDEVAEAFRAPLRGRGRFAGHFEQIVFAVLERNPDAPVRAAFARAFGEPGSPPGAVGAATQLQP
ncbi:TIGR02452 family protein [uncultured Streptomyces sp.]|uniref:TIGR02452 family protein n=1 Tax=uncultured Streptomyces sp. TaxID=174707 RepID=UPI00261D5D06|nr:TIGR02452 family protein [uncultured Streptomyces sp.]